MSEAGRLITSRHFLGELRRFRQRLGESENWVSKPAPRQVGVWSWSCRA